MKASRLALVCATWLGLAPFVAAQPAPFRHEMLALLPDDFAVCVVMHDLRGHADRWEKSAWFKSFRGTSIGKALFESPEMQQFQRMEADLKKHLDLDWPTVRDDILGDTLILAYSPGAKNKTDDEQGLFLLHVRKPEKLVQVIDKLNETQKVKTTAIDYKGETYHRRIEGDKTQYYYVKDSIAAVASREDILRNFLARQATSPKSNPWKARFQQAGAESAFITLCVNPRMLDAEILSGKKSDDPLPGYWKGLQAIFVTLAIQDEAELRISIQADLNRLPEWAKGAFVHTSPPSALWSHFPEQSIMTLASRTDFAGLADALKVLVNEKDSKKIAGDLTGIGKFLRLDLYKDILPNIGPDWGVCVVPSKDAKRLPHAIAAVAVKPGNKDQRVDQLLFSAVELFAGFPVRAYNENNPDAPIQVKTVMQDKVEVKYLANDKLFPAGFQPACALKDGFLVFATSPEAIADFKFHDAKLNGRKDTPLLRVSAPELAKLLDQRREHVLAGLVADKMPMATAKKNLEDVIGVLGLFDRLTLSQSGDGTQASWMIRLTPAK